MKKTNSLIITLFLSLTVFAQYDYEASKDYPFGKPNPEAPQQIKDFEPMIGECQCKSSTRKQDGSWNEEIDMLSTHHISAELRKMKTKKQQR